MQRLKYEKFYNSGKELFDYYIQRYEYELNFLNIGNDFAESERLNAS